jgi:hypothetical protein
MTLVENAKDWWRWISIRAMALAAGVEATWLALPEDLKADISPDWKSAVTIFLMAFGTAGRMVKQ